MDDTGDQKRLVFGKLRMSLSCTQTHGFERS